MIDMFSVPDLEYVSSFAAKGEGPDEMMFFPMFCRSFDDKVNIWGYDHTLIRSYNFQNNRLSSHDEWRIPTYEAFNQMHIIQDSLLVYLIVEDGAKIKKIDYKKRKVLDELIIDADDVNGTCFDLSRGTISMNEDFLVYAYYYKDQIDIYSLKDFNLLNRIRKSNKKQRVAFGDFENLTHYYSYVFVGENYIYSLYHGNLFTSSTPSSMIIYNHDLELIEILRLQDKPVLIEVDEKNNCFYGYDPHNEDYLLKYKLKNSSDG